MIQSLAGLPGEHNRMLKFEAGHGGQVPGQAQCPRNLAGGQGGEAGGQFCHVLNQVYGGGGGAPGGYHGYYGDAGGAGGAGEGRQCVTDYLAAVNRHSHKQHYIQVSEASAVSSPHLLSPVLPPVRANLGSDDGSRRPGECRSGGAGPSIPLPSH